MKYLRFILVIVLALPFLFFFQGCTCLDIKNMPPVSNTDQIVYKNVVIKAGKIPNGDTVFISLADYCPVDGINEITIPWSETDTGAAEFASINFPAESFGDGPSKVQVNAAHYNQCILKAYDIDNNLVSTVNHTAGQGVLQVLTLSGGKISRIDILGAEIGIRDICYSN